MWTDQAYFTLGDTVNTQTCLIWWFDLSICCVGKTTALHLSDSVVWVHNFLHSWFVFFWRDNSTLPVLQDFFRNDPIISKHFPDPWPSRFHNLNPFDIWLWGYLKDRFYLGHIRSLTYLKPCMNRHVAQVTSDMMRFTWWQHFEILIFIELFACALSL